MKNIWVIANFKSNETLEEVLNWVGVVGPQLPKRDFLKVVVCPTNTALVEVKKAVQVGNFPLMIGCQDLSPFEEGAHTGEEPGAILKQFVELAILGHSERRQTLGETDELISQKVSQAKNNEIIPLVCVQGKETPVPEGVKIVAYEPVFAIGSGTPDTPENAEEVIKFFKEKYGEELDVLYGGSVNDENVKGFVMRDAINGVLIGKSSLDPEEFIKIVNVCTLQS